MNIEERIKEVDLRPSDIVKLQVPPSQPVGKKPRTPIDLSQATGWLKDPTATKAIEQLLWRLCDEKVESGLTFSKPGRKKEPVLAEIFSEQKQIAVIPSLITPEMEEMAKALKEAQDAAWAAMMIGAPKIQPTQEEAKKWVKDFELPSGAPGIGVEKIPAKKPLKLHTTTVGEIPTTTRSIHLQPFATNTMDTPMTRKLKSDRGVNHWILYCAKNKYRLELADVGCSIVTEEGTFVLSDFAKK